MNDPSISRALHILYLEDEPRDRELVAEALAAEGLACRFTYTTSRAEFEVGLEMRDVDLIFSDFTVPSYGGTAALAAAQKARPEIPFLFVSGTIGEQGAVESLKSGAIDYVLKDHMALLAPAVRRALRETELRSARLEAERELRISEAKFRSYVQHTPHPFFVADSRGRYVDFNPAAEATLGYGAESLLSLSISDIVFEEDRQFVLRDFAVLAGEGRLEGEYRLKRKDGEQLWVSLRGVKISNDRFMAFCQDITERRRAEQRNIALSKLGQRLSAAKTAREAAEIIIDVADQLLGWDACTFDLYSAAENKMEHVLTFDTVADRHVECTPVFLESAPSELVRRIIEDGGYLILKEAPPQMIAESRPFGDTSRPSASVLFASVRDGTEAIALLSIHSYRLNAYQQQDVETLRMLADHCGGALSRIRAHEALQATQQRLNSFFTAAAVGLALFDKDLRFVQVNDALAEMNGLSAGHHTGRTLQEILPDLAPVIEPMLQQVMATGRPVLHKEVVGETRGHPEAQRHWVESFFPVAGKDGNPECVGGVVVEITERKQLEAQLRQSQKMEAVGQLAGGIAHDFNNILAVMRGYADLMLMESEQLNAEARDNLKQIISAGERAAKLTRQLLVFSRKQIMAFQPLVLSDAIADLSKMLKRIIGERINLQYYFGEGLPQIQADAGMMEQVLVNLTVNARDAMPDGGCLEVAIEKIHVNGTHARTNPEARIGDFVRLTVRDNGSGMAPEHLPHIFEPFFTTKEPSKGTGLGLATVYGIIKQHQGWIEISSRPGEGSTFSIFLPALSAPANNATRKDPKPPPRGGTETILLVEDDFTVRTILRRVLETNGYQVFAAGSVPEALKIWSSHADRIDLLLTDIIMPEEATGRDLSERLRSERSQLKTIFMSGYSTEMLGKDTDFFHRKENHFLQKPCSANTLIETVRRCLDKEKRH